MEKTLRGKKTFFTTAIMADVKGGSMFVSICNMCIAAWVSFYCLDGLVDSRGMFGVCWVYCLWFVRRYGASVGWYAGFLYDKMLCVIVVEALISFHNFNGEARQLVSASTSRHKLVCCSLRSANISELRVWICMVLSSVAGMLWRWCCCWILPPMGAIKIGLKPWKTQQVCAVCLRGNVLWWSIL